MHTTQSPVHQSVTQSRILAIDLGARRIGLAVSDPLGITAQGLPTYERRNKRQDLGYLKSLVQEYNVSLLIVGNPLNMDGTEGPASEEARLFASQLQRHLHLPVELWDERLTTVEAGLILDSTGHAKTKRKSVIDRVAAVLLLESYMDSLANHQPFSVDCVG